MSQALQAVRQAAVDGRLRNTIYRQTQLEKLQRTVLDNADAVERAIKADCGSSYAEATVEFFLALQTIKDYYGLLNEEEALKTEYAVARGEDAPDLQDAIGVVCVVLSTHTIFYSTILAVTAAIASGNCVVLEVGKTLLETPALLQRLLEGALDPSIVAFVSSPATDEDLGPNHIRVFQDGIHSASDSKKLTSTTSARPIISPSESRVIAVVDRTADVAQAARALVTARLSFRGNSPYSPDIILVNEFVKQAFLVAVMEATLKLTASLSEAKRSPSDRAAAELQSLFSSSLENKEIELTTSTSRAALYEIKARNTKLLRSKISGPNIVVLSVRSLDDAITVAGSKSLLASYIFAAPTSAKYLCQFIPAQVSFVNQAPLELLVGPASPQTTASSSRSLRYPPALFSVPRAQFITPSPLAQELDNCLLQADGNAIGKALQRVSSKLEPAKKRSVGGQVGFFEQGIFIGLGTFGTASVLSLGTIGYLGFRAFQRLRS